jgi:hypothetical protein
VRRWRPRAEFQNTGYDALDLAIGRDPAFGMELAQRDAQGAMIRCESLATVQREIHTLPDADACKAGEQEGIGKQVVSPAEFLLQLLILFKRERPGEILISRWEVLAANQIRLERVALGRQIFQQTAEAEQVKPARSVAQGRILLAQETEPTEQMRIAAEFGEAADLGKSALEET